MNERYSPNKEKERSQIAAVELISDLKKSLPELRPLHSSKIEVEALILNHEEVEKRYKNFQALIEEAFIVTLPSYEFLGTMKDFQITDLLNTIQYEHEYGPLIAGRFSMFVEYSHQKAELFKMIDHNERVERKVA